jgi:hypothetical protein
MKTSRSLPDIGMDSQCPRCNETLCRKCAEGRSTACHLAGCQSDSVRYLGEVQRLEVNPGEVLVLTVPHVISTETEQRLREQFRRLKLPEHQLLILSGGMRIGVLGAC